MGETAEACKKDVLDCIEPLKGFDKENRPSFLDEKFELIYKFDVQSMLSYYKGVINPIAIERITGINSKQINHYANGIRNPTHKTVKRIEKGLHELGKELESIQLLC